MSAAPAPFPWDDVLAAALGGLGWTPETLWRATPRELAAALAGRFGAGAGAPSRDALAALMAAYPDRT